MRSSAIPLVIALLSAEGLEAKEEETARKAGTASTTHGKVYVGYQGWFNAEVVTAPTSRFDTTAALVSRPGLSTVEMWPDVSDFSEDERYPTPLKHADEPTGHLFSSTYPRTVATHFGWMNEYGIDGASYNASDQSTRARPSSK